MFFYNWNLTRPQQQDTIESQVENEKHYLYSGHIYHDLRTYST